MAKVSAMTALGLFLLFCSAASAQESLVITADRAMSFGSLVANGGGSVTISPGGQRTAGGAVILVPSVPGQAATFSVQGNPDATFYIDLPSDTSIKLAGPGVNIPLTGFTSQPTGAGGQLNSGGTSIVSVGATLEVGSGQPPGDYSGSFTVIVNYN